MLPSCITDRASYFVEDTTGSPSDGILPYCIYRQGQPIRTFQLAGVQCKLRVGLQVTT